MRAVFGCTALAQVDLDMLLAWLEQTEDVLVVSTLLLAGDGRAGLFGGLATAKRLFDFSVEVPSRCVLRADDLGVVVGVVELWLLSDFLGFPIASNTIYVLNRKNY